MIDRRKHNALIILATITTLLTLYYTLIILADKANAKPLSPLSDTKTETIVVEKLIYITPKTIEDKIKAKFGKHADKAFLLLKGRGNNTCAENRNLDPRAVNNNGDGSQDFGVFQLNSYWNGFNKYVRNTQFLFNEDINIEIAYQIFKQDGYTFNAWTCGKVYKI